MKIGENLGIRPDEMMFVGDSFSNEATFSYITYSVLYEHINNRMNTEDIVARLRQKVNFVITNFQQLPEVLEGKVK